MLIFGWQTRVHTLAIITLICGHCGNPAAHALRKVVTKFEFFFIPLFPISTKHYLECTWCGASFPVAKPQIPELLARANAETMGPAQYPQPVAGSPHAQWTQQSAPNTPPTNWQR
ncbi:zinc-ribbon domain-containing protein [Nocardia sp. NPDC057455]|uniref:zinc-ribbon domain-containing protein n=1 Tax=Nocardia sp. NPDC057455 TaxID=3346138 RepID=UPI00366FD687